MIKITIEGDYATAYGGPFESLFVKFISSLSGRRVWDSGTKTVRFEAGGANLRKLRSSDFAIEWSDTSNELKALEEFELLPTQHGKQQQLVTDYKPALKLFKHQQDALNISAYRTSYAYLLEMGLGKTAVAIANAGILYSEGKIDGVLVIAPLGVTTQWIEEQIPLHIDPRLETNGLLWKGKDISVEDMSKPGMVWFAINTDAIRTKRGLDHCKRFLHMRRCMMIVDESHLIKSPRAARTKAALALGALAPYRRIMTGTPIAKNIVDAWSQFKFLDQAILGHRYVVSFRSRYCIMGGFEGREIVGQKNTTEFYTLIAPHSFRLTKAEALDLPEKMYVTRNYDMGEATKVHYKSMKQTFMTEVASGDMVDASHAAVALLRLQQIICGYLPHPDGGVELISNERIDVAMEIVRQVQGPVVIWCRFVEDIRRLVEALEVEEGKGCTVSYYGATTTTERKANVKKFLDGEARFFVSNAASGGVGLNLQGKCQTVIYYSNSFAALDRWQSEDRTHRMGMFGAVTYFDIVANRSVDKLLLRNLRNKKSISDLTLDQIRQMIQHDG